MKKYLSIIGAALTLLALFFFESPYSVINRDHMEVSSIPYEVAFANLDESEMTSADQEMEKAETEAEGSDEAYAQNYTLEMVLKEKSEMDGYIVETYREYQIYRDENGVVTKKVPTSNYDYIRYKK